MARHISKNRQSRDYSQDSHVIELTLFTSYRLFRRLKESADSKFRDNFHGSLRFSTKRDHICTPVRFLYVHSEKHKISSEALPRLTANVFIERFIPGWLTNVFFPQPLR
jgi:hypothetical protein